MNFLQDNVYKLIFTTVAALIIGVVSKLILERNKKNKKAEYKVTSEESTTPTVNFYNTINNNHQQTVAAQILRQNDSLARRKLLTKILFIDDDTQFKVINILQKAGWVNTTLIKDIENIDDIAIKQTDIFFVDIQGVGKELGCTDEGLGLAIILRKKYKDKKIIIYSAETKGDRFHEALTKADALLAKNAEPYEFQELVEQYSLDLYPDDKKIY